MQERILITGGSGFVGACLARALIAEGHDVHLLLRPGHRTWRLADLGGRYTPHFGDLREEDSVRRAVALAQPEVVFHLATHGAYPTQKNREEIFATNVEGTENLLSALSEVDYRAFVHAGSSSEYGHKNSPMRETDLPQPRGDYATAKVAATNRCLEEAERGKPVCVVRLFSTYGPWEEPNRLVPYVMGCCQRGENPRVTAGSQPRDFIAVSDVVALLKLASKQANLKGKILHAGTGVQSRVRDMIEAIIKVSGRKIKPQYGVADLRPDEPERWVACIEQTKALTGWQPKHDLINGVRQMWTWQQQRADRKQAA